jgi:transposase-like protein
VDKTEPHKKQTKMPEICTPTFRKNNFVSELIKKYKSREK